VCERVAFSSKYKFSTSYSSSAFFTPSSVRSTDLDFSSTIKSPVTIASSPALLGSVLSPFCSFNAI